MREMKGGYGRLSACFSACLYNGPITFWKCFFCQCGGGFADGSVIRVFDEETVFL